MEPNAKDSSTQMSLSAPKVSVTSSTIADRSMDPGLLNSRYPHFLGDKRQFEHWLQ